MQTVRIYFKKETMKKLTVFSLIIVLLLTFFATITPASASVSGEKTVTLD